MRQNSLLPEVVDHSVMQDAFGRSYRECGSRLLCMMITWSWKVDRRQGPLLASGDDGASAQTLERSSQLERG
jgi:hypothetical protein